MICFEQKATHKPMWDRIQPLLIKQRLPHAFLFSGTCTSEMPLFIDYLMATLNCQTAEHHHPCGACISCRLLSEQTHPDIHFIRPERTDTAIKVDQIRLLQQSIHQSTQLGKYRFIVVDLADQLNLAAANAILKVLEEPPPHTIFTLIAHQPSLLPETLRSRCQHYHFNAQDEVLDYVALMKKTSKFADHFSEIEHDLQSVFDQKMTNCAFAAKWSRYELEEMMRVLYVIFAQKIKEALGCADNSFLEMLDPATCSRDLAMSSINILDLFHRLDNVTHFLCRIKQNYSFNAALALERVLYSHPERSEGSPNVQEMSRNTRHDVLSTPKPKGSFRSRHRAPDN
jgi:DNA polymerase-3 subunit delta'